MVKRGGFNRPTNWSSVVKKQQKKSKRLLPKRNPGKLTAGQRRVIGKKYKEQRKLGVTKKQAVNWALLATGQRAREFAKAKRRSTGIKRRGWYGDSAGHSRAAKKGHR